MRGTRLLGIVLASYCIAGIARGQTPGAGREADHQALRDLRDKLTTAVSHQDIPAISALFAREFVLTTVDQTVITNRESLSAYYNRMFKDPEGPIASMQTTAEADILTRFADPNTGYCYGSALSAYTLKAGRVVKIKERWTAVVVKEDGAWKVGAAHVGVNFLDNPVLTARSMGFWKKMAIALHLAKPPSD